MRQSKTEGFVILTSPTSTEIERFFAKTKTDPETGCLLWTGAKNSGGYGIFRYRGKLWLSHRWHYQIYKDLEIPQGLDLSHTCRLHGAERGRKLCVNHCKPMSRRQNMQTDFVGELHPNAAVPDALVRESLAYYLSAPAITYKDTAKFLLDRGYKVNEATLCNWLNGKSRRSTTEGG